MTLTKRMNVVEDSRRRHFRAGAGTADHERLLEVAARGERHEIACALKRALARLGVGAAHAAMREETESCVRVVAD